jgi:hypothetical protein
MERSADRYEAASRALLANVLGRRVGHADGLFRGAFEIVGKEAILAYRDRHSCGLFLIRPETLALDWAALGHKGQIGPSEPAQTERAEPVETA